MHLNKYLPSGKQGCAWCSGDLSNHDEGSVDLHRYIDIYMFWVITGCIMYTLAAWNSH